MALWNAVKNIRIEKRSKGANALMELVSSRTTRFQTELVALRPLTPQNEARRALEAVVSIMRTLPANIKGMEFWCSDAEPAFRAYIDAFVYDAPHAQQRKAPFIFLEDLKDILQIAESRMSMPMGVQTISNLCLAARRTLIVQISALNTGNFDFGYVRSFETNKIVSASFDPVNILDRQVFDLVLSSSVFAELNLSCVAELLVIRSHGNNSLAMCRVENTGQRSLMFPNFRGDELEVTRSADTLTLTSYSHVFNFQSHSDQMERWYSILRNLFDTHSTGTNSSNEYDSLGISMVKHDPARAVETEMVRDESYDSFTKPLSKREISLNNLKRVSVGLPSGFTDDLKALLNDLQEEEQERLENPAPLQPPQPVPSRSANATPSPSDLYLRASDEMTTELLPTPNSMLSARSGVLPSPPAEKLQGRLPSREEIDRANEARRRIGSSILARELKARQEAANPAQVPMAPSLPSVPPPTLPSAPSAVSVATTTLFANSRLVPCSESALSLASRSVPDVSVLPSRPWANPDAAASCESLPADMPSSERVQLSARSLASLTPIDCGLDSAPNSETDLSSVTSEDPKAAPESKKAKFKSFMKKLKMEMADLSQEVKEAETKAETKAEVKKAEEAEELVKETPAPAPAPVKPLALSSSAGSTTSSSGYQRPLYALYKSTSMQSLNSNLPRSESVTSGSGVAVCSQSNNRTVALGASFSNGSLATTASTGRSLRSTKTTETTHTSVGSSQAWESFLSGIKDEATKMTQAESDRSAREARRRAELKREEEAQTAAAQAAAAAAAAAKVETEARTLDPGAVGLVTTTEPVIRRVVEEARKAKEAEDAFMATATAAPMARVREIRTAKSSEGMRSRASFTNFTSSSTPALVPSSLPPGMFSASLWVSKWTVSRWVPLSQHELRVELIPLGRGIAKVNVAGPGMSPLQLTVGDAADVRRSGRHDIQVRLGEDIYMFRARAAETAAQFYTYISAARTHAPSLSSSRDSDETSLNTLSTTDLEARRRTYVPPTLKPRRAVYSSATILEEP